MTNSSNQELKQLSEESISTALLQLMEHRNYESITITDIASRAGVSRMAFYRNYLSKDDILLQCVDKVFDKYFQDIILEHLEDGSMYTAFFRYFRANQLLLSALYKSQLSYRLLDLFDKYLTILYQYFVSRGLPDTVSPYEIHYAAGGFYKVLTEWALGGYRESDEEMGAVMKKLSSYTDLPFLSTGAPGD